jgi:hypothetical protein
MGSPQFHIDIAVITEIGDGAKTLFWTDRWLHGKNIKELASHVFSLVSKRKLKTRTVIEALTDHSWISDIQGALTVVVIMEFLKLWDLLSEVALHPGVKDCRETGLRAIGHTSMRGGTFYYIELAGLLYKAGIIPLIYP